MSDLKTIFVIRLNDGTLFHTTDMQALADYWDEHQEDIQYLREYYDRDVFERCELRGGFA